jgi:hypothetical protein
MRVYSLAYVVINTTSRSVNFVYRWINFTEEVKISKYNVINLIAMVSGSSPARWLGIAE